MHLNAPVIVKKIQYACMHLGPTIDSGFYSHMNCLTYTLEIVAGTSLHDDVILWKHFPRYWPFVRGIHRPPVNSPHKGQWRGALMFSLVCACINGWVNNRQAGDLRRRRAHYDVIVMVVWVGAVYSIIYAHNDVGESVMGFFQTTLR